MNKLLFVDGTYLDYNVSIVYKSDPYEVEQTERITKEWVRK